MFLNTSTCCIPLCKTKSDFTFLVENEDKDFEHDERFQKFLAHKKTGHALKKFAINLMGISCRFEHISFCAGWALKALHTIFDYLVQTRRSDTECGKALAGWKTKFRDEIYGGYPPMMKMITTEPKISEEHMNY